MEIRIEKLDKFGVKLLQSLDHASLLPITVQKREGLTNVRVQSDDLAPFSSLSWTEGLVGQFFKELAELVDFLEQHFLAGSRLALMPSHIFYNQQHFRFIYLPDQALPYGPIQLQALVDCLLYDVEIANPGAALVALYRLDSIDLAAILRIFPLTDGIPDQSPAKSEPVPTVPDQPAQGACPIDLDQEDLWVQESLWDRLKAFLGLRKKPQPGDFEAWDQPTQVLGPLAANENQACLISSRTRQVMSFSCDSAFVLGTDLRSFYGLDASCGISRQHAQILKQGQQYFLEDLEATNGTFLNQQKLARGGRVRLASGDELTLGTEKFIFLGEGENP